MAIARFKCPKCGKEYSIEFKVGTRPEQNCECGTKCVRQFKTLGVGNVVDGKIVTASQATLYK